MFTKGQKQINREKAEKIARQLHPDAPNMAQVAVYRKIATAAAYAALEGPLTA